MQITPVMAELTPAQLKAFKEGIKKVATAKPSELVRMALKDLAWVEKSPKHCVNMSTWHDRFGYSPCAVCFAGAVMAGTLKMPPSITVESPADVDGVKVNGRLGALDEVRRGFVGLFMQTCGVSRRKIIDAGFDPDGYVRDVVIPYYSDDAAGFKRELRAVATRLAKHGL